MDKMIYGKSTNQWIKEYPIIGNLIEHKPVFWANKGLCSTGNVLPELPLNIEDMADAEKRLD